MFALKKSTTSIIKTVVAPTSSRYLSSITFRSIPRSFHNATKSSLFNGLKATPRFYSVLTESPEAKVYKYDDVKDVAVHPEKHPDSILVDVREPTEFGDGHIPGALNIPFKSSPGALDLPEEEFQEHFGFSKPSTDKELIFYCLGGVRSTAAEELANTFGYKKRGNYLGSWEDWVQHENKKN
ncbi:thiosulfate sulfurtransferase, mitochondrial precursor, putative [Candida dubliniensis CD36]|uniref:Thiosulfate sulfurtransferase, mitochondrial, putative n=1 Tax=Candida dubliniensis (strain CD36 / ATCC MYA-646 / CBS 7987 / NCPF 3949 / NRRL Y-17841) TaxID=573826 RepID=B9WMA3_CANDC|nr:thiosulfate sulfurtransferase, mitochondrial precursor, putative [Candida dubliniensis CD36]CAX40216.1 thiosulfate sulfurtransferase, mitochondrial precursor, putative [Candida dubliniensis CD36]